VASTPYGAGSAIQGDLSRDKVWAPPPFVNAGFVICELIHSLNAATDEAIRWRDWLIF